ncbi:hypothetical protein KI387_012607, partial [Taxus chinensis]
KSIGAMGIFLLCWLRCLEIHSRLKGVGPEGEEGTEAKEGAATVNKGKCVETLGSGIDKEVESSNTHR